MVFGVCLALADCDHYLQLNPKDPNGHFSRASVYERMGQYDKAIADYDQALRLKPNWIEAIGGRAGAFRKSGQFEKAIVEYDKYISLNPNEPVAFYGRGFAKILKGDLAGAAADYGRSLEMAPSSSSSFPYAALWVHLARQRLGQENAANLAAEPDAEKMKGQECEASFYEGERALWRGETAAAVPLLLAARDCCPTSYYEYDAAVAGLGRLAVK